MGHPRRKGRRGAGRWWLAAILLGIWIPATSLAATKDGAYAVKEAGLIKCDRYAKEWTEKAATYPLFVGWLAGYISAHNRYVEDTLDVAPWQTMGLLTALLGNYCKQNPDQTFGGAVNALLGSIAPTRLKTTSERVEAVVGDKKTVIYKIVLRRAQQSLGELGMFTGAIDGSWNDQTREAFEAFQTEKGLPVSGLPDQATLYNLFR